MAITSRPRGVACLVAFTVTVLGLAAQEPPPAPVLPPNPLAAGVPPMPPTVMPPGMMSDAATPATAGEILVSDPTLCCEPRKKFELLPNSLLWEPQLADKSQPRLSAVFNDTDSFFSRRTADPSIGLTAGVLRIRPDRLPYTEFQVDVFAVAHLRYSRGDEAIAQNFRAGVPVTFRHRNWVGKLGYEHTSTQLGDELFESGRRGRITFERDEVVAGLGYLVENQLRPYAQVGYAFYRNIPGEPERWRYDVGFDWFKRQNTGRRGQPFAAVNAAFNPEVDYDVTMNYQVGWMWRKNDQRLGQFRVYAEFYDGHSMFGQLYNTREQYAGFGIALDY